MGYTTERERPKASARGKNLSRHELEDSSLDDVHDFKPKYAKVDSSSNNGKLEAYDVSMLPHNTTEMELYMAIKDRLPVVAVHVDVHPESREALPTGSIVFDRCYEYLLKGRPTVLNNHPLKFKLADSVDVILAVIKRKRMTVLHERELDWPYDIRPGHPDYQPPPPILLRPFDCTPREYYLLSAHMFSDYIFLSMFRHMSLRDLLNIELTCRRMMTLVRHILGGNTFINLANPKCLWAHHRRGVATHYHTLLIQKILILNGSTLQHLHLHTLSFNMGYIVTAVQQCAPYLTHFTYAKLDNLHYTSFFGGEDISHRYVSLENVQKSPPFKIYFTDWSIPPCVCTRYLTYVTPLWTSESEMKKREATTTTEHFDVLYK